MWDEDWARLGIEPTTELGAIKKAYALKLRTTRPDDDAEAYQALRGAYERVQQWLKWQQQQAATQPQEQEPPAAVPATGAMTPPAEPERPAASPEPLPPQPTEPPPTPADSAPEPAAQPQQLVDALERCWRRDGEAGLLQAWADVSRQLDLQPLSHQTEFSVAFAQWALAQPALPDGFLKALDAHFGWLQDFRSERLLGPALAQALHEALDERLRPRPVDPAVQAIGEPLVRLYQAHQAGMGWLKLQWLLFLLQPVLSRSQAALGAQWLRVLGLDGEAQRWLRAGAKRGLWLQAGAASLVYGVCAGLVFGDADVVVAHMASWIAITALLLVLGLAGGRLLGLQLEAINPSGKRLSLRLPAWAREVGALALGIVWLLFAAWLAGVDAGPFVAAVRQWLPFVHERIADYATWGFALCGLTMARPRNGMSRCVVAGLYPLVAYLVVHASEAWLPLSSGLFIAAAWLLAGAAVHEDRFGGAVPAPAQWLLRPVLNTLVLADRWTYVTALAPLGVATGYATLVDGHVRTASLFMCWVLGILAVGWLRTKADAWGLKQLNRAA